LIKLNGNFTGVYARDYAAALRKPLDYEISYRILEDLRFVLRDLVTSPQYTEAIQMVSQAILELGNVGISTTAGANMIAGMPLMEHEENRKAMMMDLKDIVEV
jgi:hypothetical protein